MNEPTKLTVLSENDSDGEQVPPPEEPRRNELVVSPCLILRADENTLQDFSPANSETVTETCPSLYNTDLQPRRNAILEFASGIDLILKSILSKLGTNDLLSIRLVSQRFSHFSSTALEKRLHIEVAGVEDELFLVSVGHLYSQNKNKETRRHEGKVELDRFLFTLSTSQKFPCTSFTICTTLVFNPRMLSFLSYQGKYIKTLSLELARETPAHKLSLELEKFQETLMELTCLETLVLCTYLDPFMGIEDLSELPSIANEERRKNFVLPTLKFLNADSASKLWLEILIPAAPGLESYTGRKSSFLSYVIKPPARLHLLQNLFITPNRYSLQRLKKLADLMDADVTSWKIKWFSFTLSWIYRYPELWQDTGKVVHKMLNLVSRSVQKMNWEPLGFLPGIQLPVMHTVVKLQLRPIGCHDGDCPDSSKSYFSQGFEMDKIFPELKFVRAYEYVTKAGESPSSAALAIDLRRWEPIESCCEKLVCDELHTSWRLFGRKRVHPM